MFDKLDFIENRYEELSKKISDVEIIAQQELWRKYCKEHADITPIVNKYREYKDVINTINEAKELLSEKLDKEFREMVEQELEESEQKNDTIQDELKVLLLPKDPNDEKKRYCRN